MYREQGRRLREAERAREELHVLLESQRALSVGEFSVENETRKLMEKWKENGRETAQVTIG